MVSRPYQMTVRRPFTSDEALAVATELGHNVTGAWSGRLLEHNEVKHMYRNAKTAVKKTARDVDGTDLKDRIGNAGDEARNDLGNLGDDVRKAGREPKGHRSDPATTPERSMGVLSRLGSPWSTGGVAQPWDPNGYQPGRQASHSQLGSH